MTLPPSHRVKEKAAAEGFDACGIASADPIDPDNQLGDWLGRGYHADMEWMAATRAVRQDVQQKLPGTRSVVVVARNYHAPRSELESGAGRVSCYAWGRDYHRALLKPLRRLAQFVETLEEGAQTYCCIDSGPVMEKAWAARAGVGWIGKNSLVLRRDLGSYFFLGVILTTVELEGDTPLPDLCGGCRLCIDACPTEAIVESRVVDSRRCLSYQTIENRGEIPEELHEPLGDWVFGCDICQEVCPYNRELTPTTEADFHPRRDQANPDLASVEELDEDGFRARFSGTPLMRAKIAGIQRNARIVLANHSTGPSA
jgi:epoxyqueuosine reductase